MRASRRKEPILFRDCSVVGRSAGRAPSAAFYWRRRKASTREAGMEFAILGPLEVHRRGQRIELAGPRIRMALAALLLDANRVVPVGRLAEALWEVEPPAKARRQVQNCISSLRCALALAGEDDVIRTGSSGYSIRLGGDELDLTTFEAAVDEGLAFGQAGRPA